MSSRPRLSNETDYFLDVADKRCSEVLDTEGSNLSTLEPLKGRGNGDNNYTKDSVIKLALVYMISELEAIKEFREDMIGNE